MDGAENREQGESYLKQACRIQEDLCSRERTRENRDRLIRLMLSLADYYIRTGKQEDIRQAQTLCEKALHMRQELTAERNTPESRRALALACSKLGWLYHEKGSQQNLNQAAEFISESISDPERSGRRTPDAREPQRTGWNLLQSGKAVQQLSGRNIFSESMGLLSGRDSDCRTVK